MSSKVMQVKEKSASYLITVEVQDVPTGYKHTEIGVLPHDWDAVKIGTFSNILRGASPRPIDSPIWFDEKSSTGWLRISDVTSSEKYLYETEQNLSEAGIANSRFVKRNSLVMSICATVGRPVLLRKDVCIHDGFVVFQNLKADPEYMYYVLSDIEKDWARHGQTGSQMNLNTGLINSTPVPLPPPLEQRAIAEALSDVDGLLGSLEALIVKKRAIKQAAMQQLLTGKTRLPGFRGEWKMISMAKHAVLKARIGWQSLTTEEYLDSGSYHLVTGTDCMNGRVNWSTCHYVDEWRYSQDRNIQLAIGDVLLTKDGTIGKVGFVDVLPGPATLNSGVFVIRPLEKSFSPLFLFYVLTSEIFDEFLSKITAGSTITHLYQKDFVTFTFIAPSLDEQTAIAAVLSDMDTDIAALEARRDKTRALKQGMMQQLLTGRVRLVKPVNADASC